MGFVDYPAFQEFYNSGRFTKFYLNKIFFVDRYDGYCDLSSKDQRSRIVMIRERYTVSQFFVTRTEIAKLYTQKIGKN